MSEAKVTLLTRPEVALKFGCGRTKGYEFTSREDFPQPTYAFGNPRWLEAEVDAWILDQVTRERAQRARSALAAASARARKRSAR